MIFRFQVGGKPTDVCAVLLDDQQKSYVSKIGAAKDFDVSFLESNWALFDKAELVYSAGFFLTVSVDSMLKVAKNCAARDKTYCINLSAPFLCQIFKDQMASVLPFTDIVFGNEEEAEAYAEVRLRLSYFDCSFTVFLVQ